MFLPLRSQDSEALDRIEASDLTAYVNKCVHAIIVLGQERTPIKKVDLNKLVFPNTTNRTIYGPIVCEANVQLNKVFGMRLYEVEDKTKYLLVNSTPAFSKYMNHSDNMCLELTILYFILLDLFAAPDEKKTEEELIDNTASLEPNSEKMKDHLDSFVKKNYLNIEKRQDARLYSWGPRAIAEVEPENFFNLFLELNGDSSEKDWPDLKKRVDELKNLPNR